MLLRLPIPHSLFPRRVQLLHRLVELPVHRQRQHVQGARDAVQDGGFVRGGRPAQHPRRDLILVAGVADAHAQAMELAVAEVAHDVAQAVLPTVAAVELQAHGTGRQVQVVMRDQTLFGFDLVIAQRRNHGDAALVHEGGGLEQPDRFAAKAHAAALAMQLAVEGEPFALAAGKGVHQPEDEFQSSHCAASHAWPRAGRARGRTTYFLSAAGLASDFAPGLAAAALVASASASAASSATSAALSLTAFTVTTATSWASPSCKAGSSTFAGSFSCDRWMMSPACSAPRSSSMNAGRSFGRQLTSTSVRLCEITTPDILPAGDSSLFRKCSGTLARSLAFSSMRWKSMCIISCLNGCFCQSRTSTFCTLPSTFRSRIEEKNHSFLAASRMVLCSIWMLSGGWLPP